MGAVFTRDIHHRYPTAMKAEGMYIYDDEGKTYLDMCGGAAVSCLGHGHPDVLAALHQQLNNLAFAHTSFFTNAPQEKLAMMISERFGEPDARVYFTSGGSEANETAIKVAWQYWRALGQKGKSKIISRRHSYHGNTYGALSVSGNPVRRRSVGDVLMDWPRISPCYAYRNQRDDESAAEYGVRVANELEAAILQAGADSVAAFIAEPVSGASLGAVPPAPGYFKRIREICDRYNVLLIADEVMCGTGRTGTFFAHAQEAIVPDIVTLAKGIGGGYQALAATVVRRKIVEVFETNTGFDHGHTYVGHATSCTAGVAVLEAIEKYQLLGVVNSMEEQLHQAILDAVNDCAYVGDVRGRGFFHAIEFVADKVTKKPHENGVVLAKKLKTVAMRHGLMVYPSGGNAKEDIGCHILIAPPFVTKSRHIEELNDKLKATVNEVFGD